LVINELLVFWVKTDKLLIETLYPDKFVMNEFDVFWVKTDKLLMDVL
jgi:hypothetical protein